MRGAVVEALGFGITNVLRLGSNLALTRLLFPEAFGSVQAVLLLQYVLVMLADVGIMQSVAQNPRGEEEAFLNTAFTLQAIRGVILAAVACLLAWPWSLWFSNPDLTWMIPLASVGQVLSSLASTRVFVLMRRLDRAPVVIMQLVAHALGIVTTISCAATGMGAASLIVGMIVTPSLRALFSHFLPGVDHRDRFQIDPEARKEIADFGKWILGSSVLTLLVDRFDQVLLGRLMGPRGFGIYNQANMLREVPSMLNQRVISQVVYPAFARVHREEPERFTNVYYRVRLWADAAVQIALGGLAGMAPWVVAFLWDPRYSDAAWMLRILLFRMVFTSVILTTEQALMARGQPRFILQRNLTSVAALIVCMPVGYYMDGVQGLLWGTVLARLPALVVLYRAARKQEMFDALRELLPFLAAGLGFAIGWGMIQILPAWTLDSLVVEPLKAWWRA